MTVLDVFFFVLFCVGGLAHLKKTDVVFISSIVLLLFQTFALNCFDVFVIFGVMTSCIALIL